MIQKEKKYLDFAAGFAVSGLGYDNKELNQALKDRLTSYTIHQIFISTRAVERRQKN